MKPYWVLLLLCAAVFLSPRPAQGHARSTSFSYWDEREGSLRGHILIPWLELQQAFPEWRTQSAQGVLAHEGDATALLEFFRNRVTFLPLSACGTPQWARPVVADEAVRLEVEAACRTPVENIRFDLTFDVAPSHVHLVRYEREGVVISGVVTSASREWTLAGDENDVQGVGFVAFLQSGFEHILAGPDHLAFLLALLLLSTSLGGLAWLATGFTLAHSASLAIAVYGLTKPHAPTIEALIGFTVAFSALEVFIATSAPEEHRWRRDLRLAFVVLGAAAVAAAWWGHFHVQTAALAGTVLFCACFLFLADARPAWRWLLVFLFGFIHGFGFAGPLLEMSLDRADTAQALLGFNLGVEAGQIVFLAVLWPVVALLSRWVSRPKLAAGLAAGVLAAGIQWFLARAL